MSTTTTRTHSDRPANRLANERSPYLVQHAHNPVDWYPWGGEAFARAVREEKPIFLSIGYSACHWCHVMEHESFDDEATAALLNEHFVCIKVDREERPDIDQIYQLAHQVLTRRAGGWPLSMFLTPEKQPFFGGTYFPPARRHGMPSFRELLTAVADAWAHKRDEVLGQAGELTDALREITAPDARAREHDDQGVLSSALLHEGARRALSRAERMFGGFGRAPKFPNTMTHDLLLANGATSHDAEAAGHVVLTLDRMARGGIYDQLGGGFARYSTDERWLVPHFEKMLYDNAQLARLYLDAWCALGDAEADDAAAAASLPLDRARCARVVDETLAYVLREMTDAETGLFYSAQDADSEGEEGRFFVWTPGELRALLGDEDARLACAYFDVSDEGNFEHGRSVLWTPKPLGAVADALGVEFGTLASAVARARRVLFEARERRPKPLRDDKCLAAWNGLMISSMLACGATLENHAWTRAGLRALSWWRTRAFTDGALAHAAKDGVAYGSGFLDDYAAMALATLDAFECTSEAAHLQFARALLDAALARFRDERDGAFFYAPSDGEVVLVRAKDPHDHAYPGGVGLMAEALLRASSVTGAHAYRAHAEALLAPLAREAAQNPMGLATVLRASDRAARGSVELVLLGDPERDDTHAMELAARGVYLPHRVHLVARDAEALREAGVDPQLLEGRAPRADGAPVAYVCRGTVCSAPVHDADALARALRAARRA